MASDGEKPQLHPVMVRVLWICMGWQAFLAGLALWSRGWPGVAVCGTLTCLFAIGLWLHYRRKTKRETHA